MSDRTLRPADLDQVPLIGSPENPDVPWWAAKGSHHPRTEISVQLPARLIDELWDLQDEMGIAVSDLVASYVQRGTEDAKSRRRRYLDDVEDLSNVKGWMPSGTPILRTDD